MVNLTWSDYGFGDQVGQIFAEIRTYYFISIKKGDVIYAVHLQHSCVNFVL